jgi:hypothetical protein
MTTTGTLLQSRARRLALLPVLALGLTTLGVVTAAPALAAPPGNDNLSAATALTVGATVSTTTAEATREPTELGPADCDDDVTNTVWFKFTAASTQALRLESSGGATGFDTVIGLWSGPAAAPTFPLTEVDCDDDSGTGSMSRLDFNATSGTTYYVQLGNFSSPQPGDPGPGPVQLTLSDLPPANDDLANAATVASDRVAPVNVSTVSATRQTGEVTGASCTPDYTQTVWLKYTAAASGSHQVQANGSLDTYLSVWSGPTSAATFPSLTQVSCADGGGTGNNALALFTASAGTTYYVQVATKNATPPGDFTVTFSYPTPGIPGNDNLADAIAVTNDVVTDTTTAGATLEASETGQAGECADIRNTVWFKWQAPSTSLAVVETLGGAAFFDSVVNVWTDATSPPAYPLTATACADQGGGSNLSKVQFTPTAGTTYYIQVASYSDPVPSDPGPGKVQVRVRQLVTPANDNLAAAAAIALPSTTDVDNTVATKESGEPTQTANNCDSIANTVWFKYTPTATGGVTVDTLTTEPARDTVLEIWSGPASGPAFGTLTAVACNDDSPGTSNRSKVSFLATAGTTYYIQAGTFSAAAAGPLKVRVSAFTPSPTTTTLDAQVTGQQATLNATVGPNGSSLEGSVEFFDGPASLGSVPLAAGAASKSVSSLAPGQHVFKAVFTSSDFQEGNSEDTDTKEVVGPATPAVATTTKLTVPKKVVQGKKAKITVSVTTASGAAASGTVAITVGGKTKTVTLVNGKATLTTGKLKKPGKVTVTASYAATSTTLASTATAKITVKKKPKKK